MCLQAFYTLQVDVERGKSAKASAWDTLLPDAGPPYGATCMDFHKVGSQHASCEGIPADLQKKPQMCAWRAFSCRPAERHTCQTGCHGATGQMAAQQPHIGALDKHCAVCRLMRHAEVTSIVLIMGDQHATWLNAGSGAHSAGRHGGGTNAQVQHCFGGGGTFHLHRSL